MKKILLTLLLAVGIGFGQRYYLPQIQSTNGRPLQNKTVKVYDNTGASVVATATWDKGAFYYLSTKPSPNYYDIKILTSGSTYATLFDDYWLSFPTALAIDSTMDYVNVDGTKITKTNDTLSVGVIDSSDVTDGDLSIDDLNLGATLNRVLAVTASGNVMMQIDSTLIKNSSVHTDDLAGDLMVFQPDTGIKINKGNGTSIQVQPGSTYNFDIFYDDTTISSKSRYIRLKAGGANSGVSPTHLSSTMWDSLRHYVADYFWFPENVGYETYVSDSITVSDSLVINAAQYAGRMKRIRPTGTSTGNLQEYTVYMMVDPKTFQYAWGDDGGDPTNVISVMFRGNDTDSTVHHWTFDIYNLLGSNVDSAPEWYYPAVANTWEEKVLDSNDITMTTLLNEPFVVKFTVRVATTDVDNWIDLAYFKTLYDQM